MLTVSDVSCREIYMTLRREKHSYRYCADQLVAVLIEMHDIHWVLCLGVVGGDLIVDWGVGDEGVMNLYWGIMLVVLQYQSVLS